MKARFENSQTVVPEIVIEAENATERLLLRSFAVFQDFAKDMVVLNLKADLARIDEAQGASLIVIGFEKRVTPAISAPAGVRVAQLKRRGRRCYKPGAIWRTKENATTQMNIEVVKPLEGKVEVKLDCDDKSSALQGRIETWDHRYLRAHAKCVQEVRASS